MRRVLMIAERYPPFNTSGAGRPFYFSKYLPEFGYEPAVIASRPVAADERDESLLAELPSELRVWRTPRLVSPILHRWRAPRSSAREEAERPTRTSRSAGGSRLRTLIPYLGWWVHWELDWGMIATAAAWILAKGTSPEVLWVSAPHFRSLPVAARLASALSIPMVVDLRDPWTYGSLWHPKTPAIAMAEQRWARRVLGAAARIVFTSPLTLEAMHERFPELDRARLVTITNGFDDAPIQARREQAPEQCLFRYVGMLNERRQPDPLITAFACAARDPVFRERAALEFVGNAGGHEGKTTLAPGCRVRFRGPVSRAESLRLMAGSDVNILLQTIAEGHDVVSGKAFDYLHARRPIIAAVNEAGGDAWLVRETGAGSVVPWTDTDALARELLVYQRRHQAGSLHVSASDIERFSRRRLTASLARLFDDVLEGVAAR
jgi:hypothetical protein